MILVRLARVRRRWQELHATVSAGVLPIRAELRRMEALAVERRQLSRPHRFIWRWYRHPLTQALREARHRRKVRLERAAP